MDQRQVLAFLGGSVVAIGTANAELVTVPATAPWPVQTSDVIPANAGSVSVVSWGTWTSGTWTGGPDGFDAPAGGGYLDPDARPYSLIAKSGGAGEPFPVYSNFIDVVTTAGPLYFSMNDVPGNFGDNSGEVTAKVLYCTTWEKISVSAESAWPISKLFLNAGERFIVKAEGEWTSGSWTGGPEGDGFAGGDYLAPDLPAYSLIGRIGDNGDPFTAGYLAFDGQYTTYRGIADKDGILQFSMNDVPGNFGDNFGDVNVWVGIVVPGPGSLALVLVGAVSALGRRRRR